MRACVPGVRSTSTFFLSSHPICILFVLPPSWERENARQFGTKTATKISFQFEIITVIIRTDICIFFSFAETPKISFHYQLLTCGTCELVGTVFCRCLQNNKVPSSTPTMAHCNLSAQKTTTKHSFSSTSIALAQCTVYGTSLAPTKQTNNKSRHDNKSILSCPSPSPILLLLPINLRTTKRPSQMPPRLPPPRPTSRYEETFLFFFIARGRRAVEGGKGTQKIWISREKRGLFFCQRTEIAQIHG